MKVLFPGSFDPITKGHTDIINQAISLFDEVYIAVLQNPEKKNSFFTLDERINLIKELYKENDKVKVVTGKLAVNLAEKYNCKAMIRGLRSSKDFEYEKDIYYINRNINKDINTICLFASSNVASVSSTTVRELFKLDLDISFYVEDIVREKMLVKKR